MGRKKLTKAQIKAKAVAAAKRMTHGKGMKALSLLGPAVYRGMQFGEDKDANKLAQRIGRDQSGIDFTDGSFELDRLAKGYGGAVFNKIERAIFKGAGVPPPSVRRKGYKAKIGLGIYHAAALANASGGPTPKDKFRRFYHSHFGVNMEYDGMAALDYSKPLLEKIVPYVLGTKLMAWASK